MAGRMDDLRLVGAPADYVTIAHQLIDLRRLRRSPAEPGGLLFEHTVQIQIVGMYVDRRSGCFVHAAQSNHMVDVRVRNDNGSDFQLVPFDHFQNPRCIIARIDDDCFSGLGIAQNVTVALQHANRQDFMDEFLSFGHGKEYSICVAAFRDASAFALLVCHAAHQIQAVVDGTSRKAERTEKLNKLKNGTGCHTTSQRSFRGPGLPEESAFSSALRKSRSLASFGMTIIGTCSSVENQQQSRFDEEAQNFFCYDDIREFQEAC
jgi:hypothetical protein